MIILDTHVLVWFISSPDNLSLKAKNAIEKEIEKNQLLVSSISVWEIYMLVKKKRLKFTVPVSKWMEKVESLSFINFIPVDNQIAAKSVILPKPFHQDPADRIIVATAIIEEATLITGDKRILDYPYVKSLW
jgi:PIN domain nuclease of toxin-antitoxin system